MSYKSFVRDLRSGGLTRRDMLATLASVGLVATTFPRQARADVNLTVFTWAGYDSPKFHQAFIKEHGASPHFAIFGEVEEGLQKLRAGFTADVGHPCSSSAGRWKDAGVLRPLDVSRIEHWNDIFPAFRKIPGITIDGVFYTMPFDWGNESVIYRTDKVQEDDNTIGLMADDKYKGKVAMFDSSESMAAITGVLSGAKDPFAMTDAEINKARPIMKKINANARFYWTDATQVTQALASGEIVAAWGWNATMVDLKKQNIPVAYMQPKEGIFTWLCGLTLLKNGAGSIDLAYDFLNAMLDPETGKNLITDFGYGHSNSKSFDLVPHDTLVALGISNPTDLLEHSRVYAPTPPATKEKLIKIYDEVKSGL